MKKVSRRGFLVRSGLLGASTLYLGCDETPALPMSTPPPSSPDEWEAIRAEFDLSPDLIHLGGLFLASHPKPVRAAIELHRRGLDLDPVSYFFDHAGRLEEDVRGTAAQYLGGRPDEIAL